MPISVFPERMDKLDPEDVNASLRTLETYVHYICERTEFAITNTFRTTNGLGSSAEAISLVLQEAVDDLSSLTGEVGALASAVNGKVDKVEGMGLSSNDYTDADKEDVDAIDGLADRVTNLEEQGGEANVIEIVKRNGTALPVAGKAVDVTVPTNVGELTNDSGYQNAQQVQAAIASGLAFLLTSVSYGPAALASFNGVGDGLPLKACQVDINLVQAGSGTPSPSNVRPISGWTGAQIHVSPTPTAGDGKTYTVDWTTEAGTVYGGTLDVLKGTLTVKNVVLTVATAASTSYGTTAGGVPYLDVRIPAAQRSVPNGACVCSMYSQILQSQAGASGKFRCYSNSITVYDSRFTSKSSAESTLASDGFAVVYPLAEPITYHLTPQMVTTLAGANNIWADTGDVTVEHGAFLAALQAEIERLQEGGN